MTPHLQRIVDIRQRNKKHITVHHVAVRAGLARSTIRSIEEGLNSKYLVQYSRGVTAALEEKREELRNDLKQLDEDWIELCG